MESTRSVPFSQVQALVDGTQSMGAAAAETNHSTAVAGMVEKLRDATLVQHFANGQTCSRTYKQFFDVFPMGKLAL